MRAVRQMLLGLAPLLVIAAVLLALLGMRLTEAQAPLGQATASAVAVVTATGLGDQGRQVALDYTDDAGNMQSGRVTLRDNQAIPLGARISVIYNPDRPSVLYSRGDATAAVVGNLINGLLLIGLITLVCVVVTLVRLLRRRRLAGRPTHPVQIIRSKRRRGLSDRSWLRVDAGDREVWVPVYWEPALERVSGPEGDPVAATAHGSPLRDALISVEVGGATLWPSGRRRTEPPRGTEMDLDEPPHDVSLLRQVRGDIAVVLLAPILGLLWAYVDESGPGGFAFATAVCAGVLFWLPATYGSDPT